jgi:probable rRNA maturation factor
MARDPITSGSITVRNSQRGLRVDFAPLQEFAVRALERVRALPPKPRGGLDVVPHVTVVLVSDRRIAALHRQFMGIAGPTDVITFHEGDIFISVDTAKRNARRFGTSLLDEIRLYIIHGLLHLHGFDDATAAKSRAMDSMQQRILRALASQ